VFASDGYRLCELGAGKGAGLGQFEGLSGLSLSSPAGLLYTADYKLNRIQVSLGRVVFSRGDNVKSLSGIPSCSVL
jgi:hypothetical protein